MKKALILLLVILSNNLMSQSLVVFDVDTSNFPVMKAKFFAFDVDGRQIMNLRIPDFEIKENGLTRNILNMSCPAPKPPAALSSVLVLDISGSMTDTKTVIAKDAVRAWIAGFNWVTSESALTVFHDENALIQGFTNDSLLLIGKLDNVYSGYNTLFNKALLDPPAGGIPVAKNGRFKRVIVMITDGYPSLPTNTNEIIYMARQNNVIVFPVTMGYNCPQDLKDIALQTGGTWFENVTTTEQAREVYLKILSMAQASEPCTIEWNSETMCGDTVTNVNFRLLPYDISQTIQYSKPEKAVAQLSFNPGLLIFKNKMPGKVYDTTITITANNSDFVISKIRSTKPCIKISPDNLSLKAGERKDVTVSYTPVDYEYESIELFFDNDACPAQYLVSSIHKGKKTVADTLKLTHPNGGESFVVGSDSIITWQGIGENDTVRLEYSTDGGKSWVLIAEKAVGLKYIWKNIPKPASPTCLVKVKQINPVFINDCNPKWTTLSINGKSVEWSPDNTMIAISGAGLITVVDAVSYKTLHRYYRHYEEATEVHWSPDGTKIASSGDRSIKIWNVADEKLIFEMPHGYTNCFNWSPDGKWIAAGLFNSTDIKIWEVENGIDGGYIHGNSGSVIRICWSPDGKRIATVSDDRTCNIWDFNSASLIKTVYKHHGSLDCVSWSPDGKKIAIGSTDEDFNAYVKIWDASTYTMVDSVPGHTFISWSPDSKSIATIIDNVILTWDVSSGKEIKSFNGHLSNVYSIDWSSDGRRIVSTSYDKTVKIWDAADGSVVKKYERL